MTGGTQKEIADLLEKIVVFEVKFKKEVLQKSINLEEWKLQKLLSILAEVKEWQTNFLQKKLKEDPDFYYKIMEVKHKANQAVIDIYKQKFETEDHKKMEIILSKIKSL